ncbi:MAG: VCBS repeat-containing protein [Verrucomicrobiota bacterium]
MKTKLAIPFTMCAALTAALISWAEAGEANVKFGQAERLQVPELNELEGPELVDYDGDGVLDILSGNYGGNIIFRKNTGSNSAPTFAKPVKLQRGGEDIKLKHW